MQKRAIFALLPQLPKGFKQRVVRFGFEIHSHVPRLRRMLGPALFSRNHDSHVSHMHGLAPECAVAFSAPAPAALLPMTRSRHVGWMATGGVIRHIIHFGPHRFMGS
jgi:hypothetical protein